MKAIPITLPPALIRGMILMALFVTVAFPKAGFKVGAFPVYLSLVLMYGLVLPPLARRIIAGFRQTLNAVILTFVLALFVITILNILVLQPPWRHPFPGNMNIPFLMAYGLALLSFCFVGIFENAPVIRRQFDAVLLSALGVVILYAMIQKIFGEVRTVIPGLTFNYTEGIGLPSWWDKHNFSPLVRKIKLASTYQNGNVFAVNFIMAFWFCFDALFSRKGFLPKVASGGFLTIYAVLLFFTYSGTGYAGLILSLGFFWVLLVFRRFQSPESRNRVRDIALLSGIPALLMLGTGIMILFLPSLSGIRDTAGKLLFQRNLLGNERIGMFTDYIRYLVDNRLWFQFLFGSLFDAGRAGGAYEITLAAVFANSGILFTGFFVYTVFRLLRKLKLEIYNIGLFTYLAVSFIDGAYWLPPTAVVFWTLASASLYLMNGASQNRRIAAAQNQSARAET